MEIQQWIEIDDDEVIEAEGTFTGSDGNEIDWKTRKQQVYLFTRGERYPERTLLQLEKHQEPYESGKYIFGYALEATKSKMIATKFIKLIPASAS